MWSHPPPQNGEWKIPRESESHRSAQKDPGEETTVIRICTETRRRPCGEEGSGDGRGGEKKMRKTAKKVDGLHTRRSGRGATKEEGPSRSSLLEGHDQKH